jgi:hypothetical protein
MLSEEAIVLWRVWRPPLARRIGHFTREDSAPLRHFSVAALVTNASKNDIYRDYHALMFVLRHETLHKCTGIHAAVLCAEGTVDYVHWTKDEVRERNQTPVWGPIVAALDPARDVLLFPCADATLASEFSWHFSGSVSDATGVPSSLRRRLIVLEATWNHAKGMARQIASYRLEMGLPAIPCVLLSDVVGGYWRFHEEGHSALSTIEAIAHTAVAAGMSSESFDIMLALFRVQKGRVLLSIDGGNREPRAVNVVGSGEGSWVGVPTVDVGAGRGLSASTAV